MKQLFLALFAIFILFGCEEEITPDVYSMNDAREEIMELIGMVNHYYDVEYKGLAVLYVEGEEDGRVKTALEQWEAGWEFSFEYTLDDIWMTEDMFNRGYAEIVGNWKWVQNHEEYDVHLIDYGGYYGSVKRVDYEWSENGKMWKMDDMNINLDEDWWRNK